MCHECLLGKKWRLEGQCRSETRRQIKEAQFYVECVLSHSVTSDSLQPMDYSLPGSSVHGILQPRILEWVAISSSRGSSRLRDQILISCIGRQILYHLVTWEAVNFM